MSASTGSGHTVVRGMGEECHGTKSLRYEVRPGLSIIPRAAPNG